MFYNATKTQWQSKCATLTFGTTLSPDYLRRKFSE